MPMYKLSRFYLFFSNFIALEYDQSQSEMNNNEIIC